MSDAVSVILVMVAFVFCGAMYFRAIRHDAEAVRKVASAVDLTNAILSSWASYAVEEKIVGLPVSIEMDWPDEKLDWLPSAAVVIKNGFAETRYRLVMNKSLDRTVRGGWSTRGSFTFELETNVESS